MIDDHDQAHVGFVRARSEQARQVLMDTPWSADQQAHFEHLAQASIQEQARIEAGDSMPFEIYRREYLAPRRLEVAKRA
jgi:glutamate--cysteine ligase